MRSRTPWRTERWILAFAAAAVFAGGQEPKTIEAVRKYALNYVQSLPDYTCTQVTKRVYSRQGFVPIGGGVFNPGLNKNDTIEEELSFIGGKEHYKVLRVNGFAPAVATSHEQLGGAVSEGEFGSLLKHIFDPETGTTFRAAPREKIQGRAMNVIAFSVPQSKGYSVHDGERNRDLVLAYTGSVWADAETNAVMKITMKCVDIPSDAQLSAVGITLEYKLTPLSDQKFILPSRVQLLWRKPGSVGVPLEEGTNTVEFKSYRRFTAESNIDFSK
jgi:hypothetical protein